MAVSRKAMTEGIRTPTFLGTLNKVQFVNPSVKNQRFLPAPFTQGSHWVLPHQCIFRRFSEEPKNCTTFHWFAMTTPVLSASIRSPRPEVVHRYKNRIQKLCVLHRKSCVLGRNHPILHFDEKRIAIAAPFVYNVCIAVPGTQAKSYGSTVFPKGVFDHYVYC